MSYSVTCILVSELLYTWSVNYSTKSVNHFTKSINYFTKSSICKASKLLYKVSNHFIKSVNYFTKSVNYFIWSVNYYTIPVPHLHHNLGDSQEVVGHLLGAGQVLGAGHTLVEEALDSRCHVPAAKAHPQECPSPQQHLHYNNIFVVNHREEGGRLHIYGYVLFTINIYIITIYTHMCTYTCKICI